MRFMVVAAIAIAFSARPEWAFAQPSSPTAGPTTSGPVLEPTSAALTLITIAVAAIFLAWVVPLWLDARRAYAAQREVWISILRKLEEDAAKGKGGLTSDELAAFL